MTAYQEPFFARGFSPLARFTFFAILAVAVMIADHRLQALGQVRLAILTVVSVLEQPLAVPGWLFNRASDYFVSQDRLLGEKRELEKKVLELAVQGQEAALIKREHEHLTQLAGNQSRFASGGVLVEVVRDARNPFSRKIIINKGLSHGLQAGLAVIDGTGVVGQLTALGVLTSEVTLITEKDQSVPALLVRNGLRAIVSGTGKEGLLELPFIPVSADIQTGDRLVTSGIDGTYPAGLGLAEVLSVEKTAATQFARIKARPAAGADQQRYLLVLSRVNPGDYPKSDVASDEPKPKSARGPAKPARTSP